MSDDNVKPATPPKEPEEKKDPPAEQPYIRTQTPRRGEKQGCCS